MKKVLNSRYDLTGNEFSRLLKLMMIGKVIPIGNMRGGPGIRCLVVMCILHYFGKPMYSINAMYGHRLSLLKRFLRRLRDRKQR